MAGMDQPRREALSLARELWSEREGHPVIDIDRSLDTEKAALFRESVSRRALGEPLAYVVGRAGFRHLTLKVDRRVLIPRPETESVVGAALDRCAFGTVADIGTGSGAIALSLAHEGEFESVTGVDCSAGALEVAGENGQTLGLRVEWMLGDMLAPLNGRVFDMIVSNPPYLTEDEYHRLDSSVADWEPRSALAAGEDGMSAYRKLLGEAAGFLSPSGWLVLEIDSRRAEGTQQLAEANHWQEIAILDDLFGRPRILVARRES
jgi:release factor glutamine methyltransferase